MKMWISSQSICVSIAVAVLAAYSFRSVEAGEALKEKPVEITAGLWAVSKEGKTLTLASFHQPDPIKTNLTAETQLEGTCIHCQIPLKCFVSELAKHCTVCPCGFSNAMCLTGKNSAEKDWAALLQAAPRGARFRVEYANPARPEEGLKRLNLDRHGALLPVKGLEDISSEQIQSLGKSAGAVKTELNSEKTRLQLSLKDNWTAEKEQRLEKGLEKLGARVAAPPTEADTP
jgi:hypothetical protein